MEKKKIRKETESRKGGRSRTMLWKTKHLGEKIMSGTLAFLLVAASVTNALNPLTSYAVEADNGQKISYKAESKEDIQIGIEAQNTGFCAGGEVNLKIFLQNNTDETVTQGVLEWSGAEIEDGWFESPEPEEQMESSEDSELATDSDSDREEGILKNITLAPGEIYQAEFYGTVSSDAETAGKRTLTIRFDGRNSKGTKVSGKQPFTYNTGMTAVLPVEFPEGAFIESNEENVMLVRTSLEGMETVYGELTNETSSNVKPATGSDAEEAAYERFDKEDISYSVTTYGAELKGVTAELIDGTDSGELLTGVQFRVASHTEPGTYFGVITSSVKYGRKTYKASQGFHFVVTGEGLMVLKGKVNGAEIEVKGPAESFPEGDMLSLKVSEVTAEKEELLLTAIEKKAEESEISINKMKAVDIKVIADGVEQELRGDVTVTFANLELEAVKTAEDAGAEDNTASAKAASMVENVKAAATAAAKALGMTEEKTESEADESGSELAVWHLDEENGTLEDMYGTVGENGEVVMNTTHFSIFIVVDLPTAGGFINVTVEHWGTVTTIDGEANPREFVDGMVKNWSGTWEKNQVSEDTVFDIDRMNTDKEDTPGRLIPIKTEQLKTQIYTTDSIALQNQAYKNIEELSKVALAAANKTIPNYRVEKIWVTTDASNIGKETWGTGTYTEYTNSTDPGNKKEVKLAADSIIRVWYTEQDAGTYENDVTFYDHNVTDGRVYNDVNGAPDKGTLDYLLGTDSRVRTEACDNYKYLYSYAMGTNYSGNSDTFEGNGPTMGAGQDTSGNKSPWVGNAWNGQFLNAGNAPSGQGIVTGIVTGLNSDGTLQFADGIRHAKFFEETYGKNDGYFATKKLTDNYKLKFKQKGDSYVLSNVTKGGVNQTGDLEEIKAYGNGKVYSNEFWPIDKCTPYLGQDPLFGKENSGFKFNRDSSGSTVESNVSPSDFKGAHNWNFGMKYEFTFKIGDYTGPMNYYFRGDDDFWLFIDGEKAIDMGGIHVAAGQSIDIRKWLSGEGDPNTGTTASDELKNIYATDKDHVYKCTIYFMERGGFGSCCYMRYVLPNYTEVPTIPQETTDVTVTKIWDDFHNPLRPREITVKLLRNGTEVERKTFGGTGDTWTYTWEDLPLKDGSGNNYTYSVEEIVPVGYEARQDGNTITNSLNPEVKVKVTKAWDDGGNVCGDRPDSVIFRLLADGEPLIPVQTMTLTESMAVPGDSNTWLGEFEHLPKYKYYYDSSGLQRVKEIDYTVQEMSGSGSGATPLKVEGTIPGKHGTEDIYRYQLTAIVNVELTETEVTDNYAAHFKFTNSHTHKLNVIKEWSDGNSRHGEETILIGLYEKSGANRSPVSGKTVEMARSADGTIKACFDGLDPGKTYMVRELVETDSSDFDFMISGKYYKGLEDGGIYNVNYKVSYKGPENVNGHSCEQTMTITNTLWNIETKLRIGKWIDNWNEELDSNDLADDEFIVTAERTDESGFKTGIVLNHAGDSSGNLMKSKLSGYLSVMSNGNSDITFKIDEIIPKEYRKSTIFLTVAPGVGTGTATVENDTVTLTPGSDAVILVHNTFTHEDYFHDDASVRNDFPAAGTSGQTPASGGVNMAAIIPERGNGGQKSPEDEEVFM